jgi:Trypsin
MTTKPPKRFVKAHRLITGRDKLKRSAHSKAEYAHLAGLRAVFQDRNVVGVGISEKVTNNKRAGELTLCFYVRKKKAKHRLGSHKMIPPVISVGGQKPIFTDVYEVGAFKTLANVQTNPIQSGFSVGNDENVRAGTTGAIVSYGASRYILSNAHVLAPAGAGDIGVTQTTYPAIEDSEQINRIGVLRHIVNLTSTGNLADAALAEINNGLSVDAAISGARSPYTAGDAVDKMSVVAAGRTTPLIRGVVRDSHFTGPVLVTGVGSREFVDQIVCVGEVAKGDSGAMIVAEDTGEIIGLLFAGTESEFLCTSIKAVRQALGVNFRFVEPSD